MNLLEELYLYFKNYFVRTLIVYWALMANYKWALLNNNLFGLKWCKSGIERRWSTSLYLLIIGLALS